MKSMSARKLKLRTAICILSMMSVACFTFFATLSLTRASSSEVPTTATTATELGQASNNGEWKMTSTLVRSKDSKTKKHQLEFSLGKTKHYYAPQKPPLGLVFKEEVQINGKTYFVTGWAHGPSTVLYRVFSPELNKAKSICEAPSLSEKAELKMNDGKVQLSTYLDTSDKITWINCQ